MLVSFALELVLVLLALFGRLGIKVKDLALEIFILFLNGIHLPQVLLVFLLKRLHFIFLFFGGLL